MSGFQIGETAMFKNEDYGILSGSLVQITGASNEDYKYQVLFTGGEDFFMDIQESDLFEIGG